MAYEAITKLQGAERQLRVAIRLFFERRDLVAVHTLAAAAQEMLRDLGRPRGIKSFIKDNELIRPKYRKELTYLFNEAQNFFKHADRDPDRQLKFYTEATQFYLYDSASLYLQLTGQQFPELTLFMGWFAVKHPDLLNEGPIKDQIQRLDLDPDDYDLLLAALDSLVG